MTPYTPPLAATSSPKTTIAGLVTRASVSVALMVWASVSGPAFSGSLPPNASARGLPRPGRRVAGLGDGPGDPDRPAGRQRRDHLAGAGQLRLGDDLLGHPAHLPADLVVAGQDLLRGEQAGADEQRGGRDQRVAGQVGGDLRGGRYADLGVGAGVAHQPDHAQVQHGRPALARTQSAASAAAS